MRETSAEGVTGRPTISFVRRRFRGDRPAYPADVHTHAFMPRWRAAPYPPSPNRWDLSHNRALSTDAADDDDDAPLYVFVMSFSDAPERAIFSRKTKTERRECQPAPATRPTRRYLSWEVLARVRDPRPTSRFDLLQSARRDG